MSILQLFIYKKSFIICSWYPILWLSLNIRWKITLAWNSWNRTLQTLSMCLLNEENLLWVHCRQNLVCVHAGNWLDNSVCANHWHIVKRESKGGKKSTTSVMTSSKKLWSACTCKHYIYSGISLFCLLFSMSFVLYVRE